MLEDAGRRFLATRVWMLKKANVKYVKIPEDLRNEVFQRFLKEHVWLMARHQRDISRLLAVIKGHTLLNFTQREREENNGGVTIIANKEDVEEGFRLYKTVSEANELGLSPELFYIYQALKPYFGQKTEVEVQTGQSTKTITVEGITIREFQSAYAKCFHKAIGYEESRRILQTLESVGLITEETDPTDRRKSRYTLFEGGVLSKNGGAVKKAVLPHPREEYISPSSVKVLGEAILPGICELCGSKDANYVVEIQGVKRYVCSRCLKDLKGMTR